MKDVPTINPPDHVQVKLTIVEADIDIGIIPLVKWLNSFYGIMTRWSCEGDEEEEDEERIAERQLKDSIGLPYGCGPPYIVIWVDDSASELKEVKNKLRYRSVTITECTKGRIHRYHIMFSSKKEMKRIQKRVTGQ